MRLLKASGSLGEVDKRALCAMRLVNVPNLKRARRTPDPSAPYQPTHSLTQSRVERRQEWGHENDNLDLMKVTTTLDDRLDASPVRLPE